MNNLQMKNEIPDNDKQTVKLMFDATFSDGTHIENGSVTITRADWLNMTGTQKLDKIAKTMSDRLLESMSTYVAPADTTTEGN
ncbi:hypothetical protein RND61_15085 [Streptomyces sp. TRM76323]|uniref:Uncharacterized protein n=1 Tax=Streptomyces tamarix TaxID=3078565 RepID=A0ABU3QKU4_9ACTN|nr:hypothetical protein [Streptomyces tamarix]MDT9683388.1 hypothetical protein [Streptomyces tamarix]